MSSDSITRSAPVSNLANGAVLRSRARAQRRLVEGDTMWWFLIPAVAFYAFVVIVPSAEGLVKAFTDWNGLSPTSNFVGLQNFIHIFQDPAAIAAIRQTLIIAFALTLCQNGIGLLLALGIKSRIKSQRILRVIFFAPAIVSPVMTAYLWQYILAPNGALNDGLQIFGFKAPLPDWLGNSTLALVSVIGVLLWQFSGYSMLIFLAGLEAISTDVLEAADVDGAGRFRKFFSVTFPMLTPALIVNLMLTMVGGLKQFDVVWVMTQGGPGNATQTMSTLIYKNAFQFSEYGYSIALAVVLTIIAVPISFVQFRIARGGGGDYA